MRELYLKSYRSMGAGILAGQGGYFELRRIRVVGEYCSWIAGCFTVGVRKFDYRANRVIVLANGRRVIV